MLSSDSGFRCGRCGAPLEVSPETIVSICSYCGYPNWIREDLKSDIYIVENVVEEEAVKAARRYVGISSIDRPLTLFIPFYIVEAKADADYEALVRVTVQKCVRDSRGRTRCMSESVRVSVGGVLRGFHRRYPIAARKGVRGKTVEILSKYISSSSLRSIKLSEANLDKSKSRSILMIDLSRDDVRDLALDKHLDALRKKVEDEITREAKVKASIHGTPVSANILRRRITPRNIDVIISTPVLIPLYIFADEEGKYKVVLSGWDLKPLILEKPVSFIYRAAWFSAGVLVSGFAGGVVGFTSFYEFNPVLSLIAMVLGGVGSWYSVKKALRPVRVVVEV